MMIWILPFSSHHLPYKLHLYHLCHARRRLLPLSGPQLQLLWYAPPPGRAPLTTTPTSSTPPSPPLDPVPAPELALAPEPVRAAEPVIMADLLQSPKQTTLPIAGEPQTTSSLPSHQSTPAPTDTGFVAPATSQIPVAPPMSSYLPSCPFKVICR
jgi:hypothetical protein